MRTALHSPLKTLTTLLVLIMVSTLTSAAVTIAYAAGRHSHSTVHPSGATALSGADRITVVIGG